MQAGVYSTAGAVAVKNKKGELSMQKVKVSRYVAGKRPEFAETRSDASSSSSSDDDDHLEKKHRRSYKRRTQTRGFDSSGAVDRRRDSSSSEEDEEEKPTVSTSTDPRLKRLQQFKKDQEEIDEDERISRHRRIHEPEIVSRAPKEDAQTGDDTTTAERRRIRHRSPDSSEGEEANEEDLSDGEIERRRKMLRDRAQRKQKEEELLARQQEEAAEESEEEEESEYEEYTDSEDETLPRLKPVFVRKRDRITLQETEKEQQRMQQLQLEQKRVAEQRKLQSKKIVEQIVQEDIEKEKRTKDDHLDLASVNTDDENEEISYQQWKVRELKRIKRDKEDREAFLREKAEIEKIHAMTDEERREYARHNPKLVTNKAEKGKYGFLQKYYHRGAFFLDEEDDVYKRNFAQPTLEDHFDKQVLPKVMQVKDFGKAGRTKWTHLTAEDTTDFQSAWVADTAQSVKFFNKHGGGVKDVFERPGAKKKKKV